ncbi:hypothetical protein ACTXT7_001053 [Hymenolepis weldensis]
MKDDSLWISTTPFTRILNKNISVFRSRSLSDVLMALSVMSSSVYRFPPFYNRPVSLEVHLHFHLTSFNLLQIDDLGSCQP